MARRRRNDAEGAEFHVMDRGRGQSPVFLHPADFRFFLSRLAYAVRRGEIQVLAFVLMTNHYHLLLRSRGQLSEAMRRVKNDYVKMFNARYECEGSLFRSRFLSKPVRDLDYRRNVIRYIDENPLVTRPRLATSAEGYAWGSSRRFARARPTPWLCPSGIESTGISYRDGFSRPTAHRVMMARKWFIEARLRYGEDGTDSMADLLSGCLERIRMWLVTRSDAEGEAHPSLPMAGQDTVEVQIGIQDQTDSTAVVTLEGARQYPSTRLLRVGLLRDLAALSFPKISSSGEISRWTAMRLYELHARALREDPAYAALACRTVAACVAPLRE